MSSKRKLIIEDIHGCIELKSIDYDDIEYIRKIKNLNKKSFFYQDIISKEQQVEWFKEYLKRETDWIFIVSEVMALTDAGIGCMGFRVKNGVIDIYNVIRGKKSQYGVSMMDAMKLMVAYIRTQFSYEINCEVLKTNPAVEWYKKCGFVITNEYDTYYDMNPKDIESLEYIEK